MKKASLVVCLTASAVMLAGCSSSTTTTTTDSVATTVAIDVANTVIYNELSNWLDTSATGKKMTANERSSILSLYTFAETVAVNGVVTVDQITTEVNSLIALNTNTAFASFANSVLNQIVVTYNTTGEFNAQNDSTLLVEIVLDYISYKYGDTLPFNITPVPVAAATPSAATTTTPTTTTVTAPVTTPVTVAPATN